MASPDSQNLRPPEIPYDAEINARIGTAVILTGFAVATNPPLILLSGVPAVFAWNDGGTLAIDDAVCNAYDNGPLPSLSARYLWDTRGSAEGDYRFLFQIYAYGSDVMSNIDNILRRYEYSVLVRLRP